MYATKSAPPPMPQSSTVTSQISQQSTPGKFIIPEFIFGI